MEKITAPIRNEQSQEYAGSAEAVDRLPIENNALIDAVKNYATLLFLSVVLRLVLHMRVHRQLKFHTLQHMKRE